MTTRQDTDRGSSYDPSTQGTPAPEKASLVEDFIDIFYAPSTVYARREKAGYALTLLIVSVLAALFTFAARDLISTALDGDMSRAMAEQMEKNPQLTAEAAATIRGTQSKISMFMMMIATPLAVVIVAFLSWLSVKFVSVKINWQQAMVIVTLAFIPRLLSSLLLAVQGLLMDNSTVDSMTRLSFGPVRFLDPEGSKVLIALAARFDVFVLWSTILIAIGIAVMGKVPRGKGFAAAGIVWLLAGLASVIPALIAG